MKNALLLTGTAIFILLTTSFTWKCFAQEPNPQMKTVEVKVGITEYAKIQTTYHNYERLFRELAASADANEAILFRFAVGTYGEVRDWYNKGEIDVAILSAMPIGELLLAGEDANLSRAYIGDISVSRPPSTQSVAILFSDRQPHPFYYRAGCLFDRSDKDLLAIADSSDPMGGLKKLWKDKKLRFLFVRPYSLSGYIVPVTVLRAHGIDPLEKGKKDQMDFTYDHKESLKRLITPDDKKTSMHQVAFVLDDSRYETKDQTDIQKTFGRIKLPVEDYKIPREVVLANYHQELEDVVGDQNKFTRTKALMERLFNNWTKGKNGKIATTAAADADAPILEFRSQSHWQCDYNEVRRLLDEFSLPKQLLYKSTLNDLLNDLANTKESRLALVLSGGGAKCAYQAGAIVEIENQLQQKFKEKKSELEAKLTGADPETLKKETEVLAKKLDIDLVVGTSGGAINALLVAMRVTEHSGASNALSEAWKSFKQQQFLKPSLRFSLLFGFCFAMFQALVITITVILFGRQSMNWHATLIILELIVILQLIPVFYFRFTWTTTLRLFAVEIGAIVFICILVLLLDRLMPHFERLIWRIESKLMPHLALNRNSQRQVDPHHWRKLTILLLTFFGVVEFLIAIIPGLENLVDYLPERAIIQISNWSFPFPLTIAVQLPDTHWVDHGWTAIILISNWSFPFPLILALLMFLLGYETLPVFRRFNWFNWRGRAIAWMAMTLVVFTGILILEGLLMESSPSKVEGIERAFVDKIPALIRATVDSEFNYSAAPNTKEELESISQRIMEEGLLKRDLVITTSKLPVNEDTVALPVNSLPNDLYFYHRSNNELGLKPPADNSFIPLKYNQSKLVDVVIGSSTIYPIFPSRTLQKVFTGNEETRGEEIDMIRIVDGGYIHNIPIEAAKLWRATHIIVIEASPDRQERDPRVFLDHIMNAFGYLFSQAQQDALGSGTEAFVLRPTSECEKFNVKAVCTEKDGAPEPNMDTFDFSQRATDRAFRKGAEDVKSLKPLFVRKPGAPNFQDVSTEVASVDKATPKQQQLGTNRPGERRQYRNAVASGESRTQHRPDATALRY